MRTICIICLHLLRNRRLHKHTTLRNLRFVFVVIASTTSKGVSSTCNRTRWNKGARFSNVQSCTTDFSWAKACLTCFSWAHNETYFSKMNQIIIAEENSWSYLLKLIAQIINQESNLLRFSDVPLDVKLVSRCPSIFFILKIFRNKCLIVKRYLLW